jgi:putative SOS response-associated peptidase YedK
MKTGDFPTDTVRFSCRKRIWLFRADCMGLPELRSNGFINNARSETAQEKKLTAAALKRRRCVIPSTAFLDGRRKKKYLFNMPDSPDA